jgi:hypothetical protein
MSRQVRSAVLQLWPTLLHLSSSMSTDQIKLKGQGWSLLWLFSNFIGLHAFTIISESLCAAICGYFKLEIFRVTQKIQIQQHLYLTMILQKNTSSSVPFIRLIFYRPFCHRFKVVLLRVFDVVPDLYYSSIIETRYMQDHLMVNCKEF